MSAAIGASVHSSATRTMNSIAISCRAVAASMASRSSAYCLMPNHVHLILVPTATRRWEGSSARRIGASLQSSTRGSEKETPDRAGLSAGAFRGHCLWRALALPPVPPQRLVFAKDNEWLIFIRLAQQRAALQRFAELGVARVG